MKYYIFLILFLKIEQDNRKYPFNFYLKLYLKNTLKKFSCFVRIYISTR